MSLLALIGLTAPAEAQAVVELPAQDRPLDWGAEDVYSVGGIEAQGWQTFGASLRLSFAPDGTLYILDRDSYRVVAVAPDGTLAREFGREGDGPGELRTPAGIAVIPDGRVAVLDFARRAFTVFSPDGEYLETVRIPVEGGTFAMGSIVPDPRGGAIVSAAGGGTMMMSIEREDGAPADAPPPGIPIQRFSLTGGPVETIHNAWQPPRSLLEVGRGGGVRIGMGAETAWRPGLQWAVTPDGGVAFVDSTAYRVQLAAPQGAIARSFTRDIAPIPVTEGMKERERERRMAELEAGEGPQMRVVIDDGRGARSLGGEEIQEMMRERLEAMEFWPEIAAVRALSIDPRARLWIERSTEDPSEPGPIDIVSFSGEYVGTLPPDGLRTPVVFGPDGLAAYLESDEYDVLTVVVRRLMTEGD